MLGQSIEIVGGRGALEVDGSKVICDSLQGTSRLTGIFLMVHHIVQRPTLLGQNGTSEYSKIVLVIVLSLSLSVGLDIYG